MPYKKTKMKRPWVKESKPFEREKKTDFYNSWPWRKLRKSYLSAHPVCVKCEAEGKIVEGNYVDHIQRIADGGAKLDESNLQTLCKHHHNSKSGKEAHGYRENKRGTGQNT